MECRLYIRRIQGGCLNEGELIGFSKGLGLVRGHSSQVTEVRLVAHKHHGNLTQHNTPYKTLLCVRDRETELERRQRERKRDTERERERERKRIRLYFIFEQT